CVGPCCLVCALLWGGGVERVRPLCAVRADGTMARFPAMRAGPVVAPILVVRAPPVVAPVRIVRAPAIVAGGATMRGEPGVTDVVRVARRRRGGNEGVALWRLADLVDRDVADLGGVVAVELARNDIAVAVDVDVGVDQVGLIGAGRISRLARRRRRPEG